MSMNTSNLSAISPDQIEQLVVQPVQANSIALQAGTLVTTDATRTKIPPVTPRPVRLLGRGGRGDRHLRSGGRRHHRDAGEAGGTRRREHRGGGGHLPGGG